MGGVKIEGLLKIVIIKSTNLGYEAVQIYETEKRSFLNGRCLYIMYAASNEDYEHEIKKWIPNIIEYQRI